MSDIPTTISFIASCFLIAAMTIMVLIMLAVVLAVLKHNIEKIIQVVNNRKFNNEKALILMHLSDIRTWCARESLEADYVAREIYKFIDGQSGFDVNQFREGLRRVIKSQE